MSQSPGPAVARGLEGVVAAETTLSLVDGQAGRLIIGGFELGELAGHASFEQVAHLLWHGRLPNPTELADLRREMAAHRRLPPLTLSVLRAAVAAPPIDALRMATATLSVDLPDPDDITPAADLARAAMLTARFPVMVAAFLRLARGEEPVAPRAELSHAANFLWMVHAREPDPIAARALDTYWVTVCEHGMNASTFTARVIASTRSDMVSAVTGAIGALKGPLHGGAPGPVLDMLTEIGSADRAEAWLRGELAAGRRIMGFGHRVYRVRDPRADVLATVAAAMAGAALEDRQLYELARAVETVALRLLAQHRPGRNLTTNVEFFTALVLQSLGLPSRSFVAMFACGRVAGWAGHVLEQRREDRLIRPQSRYVGAQGLRFPG